MSANPTPYDNIAYRGYAYPDTHPVRLATLATLYGMNPAPPSGCRVLELGCGVGANLIPMAAQYPGSEFVGIDLSGRSIETGASFAAALGLNNIALRHASITDISADDGLFDYIIAHGVYSWVPAGVRDKMLAIYHDNLTPRGVAYVSYNSHPGSRLRDMTRDMMLFHVRDIADPTERVEQARAVLKALSEASIKESVHGIVLRDQLARVERMGNDFLFHDDLVEGAQAYLLHQVVADAGRHGLQYLCDTSLARRSLERLPDNMKQLLSQFAPAAYMARDQYHDFIDGHAFRRTLLCHDGIELDRDVQPSHIKRFHLAGSWAPTGPDFDLAKPGVVQFKNKAGDELDTDHLLTKAVLIDLGETWPAAMSFADLLNAACARLASRGASPDAWSDREVEAMVGALFKALSGGYVEFYAFAPRIVTALSERPEISRVVRAQLENGPVVTSLRHESVALEEDIVRRFVQLVDGTRNLDQLTADLAAAVAQSHPEQNDQTVTRETVESNLKMLAKMALLVA